MGELRNRYLETHKPEDPREAQRADSAVEAVGPWLELEKTDVQLWADLAKVVLLVLILRELRRGGA